MLPVDLDQTPDQRRPRFEPDHGQGAVEHVAAAARQEQLPRVRLEVADAVVHRQPRVDRGEAAAHEIALQIQRIVQIEHHDRRGHSLDAAQKTAWS